MVHLQMYCINFAWLADQKSKMVAIFQDGTYKINLLHNVIKAGTTWKI